MKVISENISNTLTIEKSVFITNIIKVCSKEEVDLELKKITEQYKDATHNCYAFIVDNYKKASDDREPSKTAGMPILNVLEKNEIDNILCVVTRYYGGIKLGKGGLIRAYSNSVVEALKKVSFKEQIDGYKLLIEVSYNEQNIIEKYIDNYEKSYEDKVLYTILCNEEVKDLLESKYKILNKEKIKIEI